MGSEMCIRDREHTDQVLMELGFSNDDITNLKSKRIVG